MKLSHNLVLVVPTSRISALMVSGYTPRRGRSTPINQASGMVEWIGGAAGIRLDSTPAVASCCAVLSDSVMFLLREIKARRKKSQPVLSRHINLDPHPERPVFLQQLQFHLIDCFAAIPVQHTSISSDS